MSETVSQAGVSGALVFQPDGTFRRVPELTWGNGVFETAVVANDAGGSTLLDGRDLWIIPGIVDAHTHLAWTDFSADARAAHTNDELEQLVHAGLAATLAAGVTSARDAGGLQRDLQSAVAAGAVAGPRLSISVELITRELAAAAGGLDAAIEGALSAGAEWIKLVATDGVGGPVGSVGTIESHFSRAEFADAVRRSGDGGARVMVHAWGGDAITWAIEAGAGSIEHGIYLTDQQARLGAERGVTLVPTLHIYRLVQRMIGVGELPASLGPRLDHAVASHPVAVRRARDAGMPIALGTDFGTTAQHGHNLVEIAELLRAELSPTEAITAATAAGAALVRGSSAGLPTSPSGVIADGAIADAVILRRDPADPKTYTDRDAIVAVIQAGRLVAASQRTATPTQ